MPFSDDMLPRLKPLAKKLVDHEMFGWLSDVSDLLAAFKSGNWPKLSLEDQERYLEKMTDTFHPRGMGDSVLSDDPDYRYVSERVDLELKAIRRKR